ncbi:hypothetical protein NDU88_005163 [Pleurodeles waltl]|uniref:Uncharacterized protein n=1 Tax=Pleurodeles waltl TaxID=8319 RepID=A0AAV7RNB4_PLEWA|nr:hypothetical protein NDU88_005163 [Pleurodeles waltl]
MSVCAETYTRGLATRKGSDFRVLFHLSPRYRVSLVIPGARLRGRWKCRLPVPLKNQSMHFMHSYIKCRKRWKGEIMSTKSHRAQH